MAVLSLENMTRGVDFENLIDELASFQAREHIFPFPLRSSVACRALSVPLHLLYRFHFRNHSEQLEIKNTKHGTTC